MFSREREPLYRGTRHAFVIPRSAGSLTKHHFTLCQRTAQGACLSPVRHGVLATAELPRSFAQVISLSRNNYTIKCFSFCPALNPRHVLRGSTTPLLHLQQPIKLAPALRRQHHLILPVGHPGLVRHRRPICCGQITVLLQPIIRG